MIGAGLGSASVVMEDRSLIVFGVMDRPLCGAACFAFVTGTGSGAARGERERLERCEPARLGTASNRFARARLSSPSVVGLGEAFLLIREGMAG